MRNTPKLILSDDFDERAETEANEKGYLKEVFIQTPDKKFYQLNFYGIERIKLRLEENSRVDHFYFTEPGLIILPEITKKTMSDAVTKLWEQGFFHELKELNRT